LGDGGQGGSRLSFPPRFGSPDLLQPLNRKMTKEKASAQEKPIFATSQLLMLR
jgi:hypothetical protein